MSSPPVKKIIQILIISNFKGYSIGKKGFHPRKKKKKLFLKAQLNQG